MSNSVNLSLDVTKTGIQNPLIKVRQGDGGFETLHTTVTSNGEPLDLQGWTITFMGTTAGNHKIVDGNVKVIEAPNGIFDYTPSKAWGMDIGEFKIAYFKFVKGDGSASSANFRVNVIEAVDLTQEEAQNYISVVDTTIAEIRDHLTNSLADVTSSVAATSSVASSMAVYVSSTASSAVSQVSSAASSASSVASSAVEKVNSVAAQVNALLIGGRNYLLNSSGSSLNGWGNIDALWSVTSDSVRGNVFTSTPAVTWTGGGTNSIYQDLGNKLVGSQVIVSFWAKSSVNDAKFHSEPQGGAAEFNPKLTTSWARYSYTIPSFSGTIYFMAVDAGTTYYLDDIKLELGNIATDWTPAPEDTVSATARGQILDGHDLNSYTDIYKYTIDGAFNLANYPSGASYWASLEVEKINDNTTIQRLTDANNNIFIRSQGGNPTAWSSWKPVANDANVVHNTGTETIGGLKTFVRTPVSLDDNSTVIEDTYTRITVVKVRGVVSVSIAVKAATPNNGGYYVDLPAWANGNALYSNTWIYLSTAQSDGRWNVSVRLNGGTNGATRIAFSANTPVGFAYTNYSA